MDLGNVDGGLVQSDQGCVARITGLARVDGGYIWMRVGVGGCGVRCRLRLLVFAWVGLRGEVEPGIETASWDTC
jgi:hypothetical protein